MPSSPSNTRKGIVITVPTKQYDGGSSSFNKRRKLDQGGTSTSRSDAFSYYSNQEIRMNRLLHSHLVNSTTNITDSQAPNVHPSHENSTEEAHNPRRTRLSFELHPSRLLDGLFEDDALPFSIDDLLKHISGQ